MTISFLAKPFGKPSLEALKNTISLAQSNDPMARVTVFVDNLLSAVSVRRELAGMGGVCNVDFTTLGQLAGNLGAHHFAEQGRKPLTNSALVPLATAVIAESQTGSGLPFHSSSIDALIRLHNRRRVDPSAVGDELAKASAGFKRWVSLDDALSETLGAYYDYTDLVQWVASAGAGTLEDKTEVGVLIGYLPGELTETDIAFVSALGRQRDVRIIAGLTGSVEADAPVHSIAERLGLAVAESELVSRPLETQRPAVRFVSVTDSDSECRRVVRQLLSWRSGQDDGEEVPFEQMVVAYPVASPYRAELARHLEAANVPYNAPSDSTVGNSLTGRLLKKLLSIADTDYSRDAVIDLLSSAPIQVSTSELVPSARWDSLSRQAGVVGSADGWSSSIERKISELKTESENKAHIDASSTRDTSYVEGKIAEYRNLAAFIERFVALTEVPEALTWASFGSWAKAMLTDLLPDHRVGWPEDEQDAFEYVLAALDRLSGLDTISANPTELAVNIALEAELSAPLKRTGNLGHGVSIGPISTLAAVSARKCIVVGCVETSLPVVVSNAGPLDAPPLSVTEQHRRFLARLAFTSSEVCLSLPRGQLLRRRENSASRWVLDQLEEQGLDRLPLDEWQDTSGLIEVERSQLDGIRRAPTDATEADLISREILESASGGIRAELSPIAHAIDSLSWGFEAEVMRDSGRYGRFNGLVPGVVELPTDKPVSASRLETYAQCPFRYYLKSVLGLSPEDSPSEVETLDALRRGSLVHEVLEDFFGEAIASKTVPVPEVKWSEAQHARLDEILDQHFAATGAEGFVGRAAAWETTQSQIRGDVHTLLDKDDQIRREHGATPIAVEAPFGDLTHVGGDQSSPYELNVPTMNFGSDDAEVAFRGGIDRIDKCETSGDVSYRVIDYKTGSTRGKKNLKEVSAAIAKGTSIQLPLYGLALREGFVDSDADLSEAKVSSEYWFCTSKGNYVEVGIDLDDHVDDLTAAMELVSESMAEGCYIPNPGEDQTWPRPTFENCVYCDFDKVCTATRGDEWTRGTVDPEGGVSTFVELTLREPTSKDGES